MCPNDSDFCCTKTLQKKQVAKGFFSTPAKKSQTSASTRFVGMARFFLYVCDGGGAGGVTTFARTSFPHIISRLLLYCTHPVTDHY